MTFSQLLSIQDTRVKEATDLEGTGHAVGIVDTRNARSFGGKVIWGTMFRSR
jgi:hypothetical protein